MKILCTVTGCLCGLVCGSALFFPIMGFWAGAMWIFVWGDTGSKSALMNVLSGESFFVMGGFVLLMPAMLGGVIGYRYSERMSKAVWLLFGGSVVILVMITLWIMQHM